MSKYEYANGERRYHHKTAIWYDTTGQDGKHWYVRLGSSLHDKFGDSVYRISNVYFATIAEAKRYIDAF